MPLIHLTTYIAAPAERVFDLSRSINLHKISTVATKEKAIDGVMNGLINEGETVTWQARHLLKERIFTSRISSMFFPVSFTDEMVAGDFTSFVHEHHFKEIDNGTIMIDLLTYETPYGILGKLLNRFYMNNYLKHLLQNRNQVIKDYAETTKWKAILLN